MDGTLQGSSESTAVWTDTGTQFETHTVSSSEFTTAGSGTYQLTANGETSTGTITESRTTSDSSDTTLLTTLTLVTGADPQYATTGHGTSTSASTADFRDEAEFDSTGAWFGPAAADASAAGRYTLSGTTVIHSGESASQSIVWAGAFNDDTSSWDYSTLTGTETQSGSDDSDSTATGSYQYPIGDSDQVTGSISSHAGRSSSFTTTETRRLDDDGQTTVSGTSSGRSDADSQWTTSGRGQFTKTGAWLPSESAGSSEFIVSGTVEESEHRETQNAQVWATALEDGQWVRGVFTDIRTLRQQIADEEGQDDPDEERLTILRAQLAEKQQAARDLKEELDVIREPRPSLDADEPPSHDGFWNTVAEGVRIIAGAISNPTDAAFHAASGAAAHALMADPDDSRWWDDKQQSGNDKDEDVQTEIDELDSQIAELEARIASHKVVTDAELKKSRQQLMIDNARFQIMSGTPATVPAELEQRDVVAHAQENSEEFRLHNQEIVKLYRELGSMKYRRYRLQLTLDGPSVKQDGPIGNVLTDEERKIFLREVIDWINAAEELSIRQKNCLLAGMYRSNYIKGPEWAEKEIEERNSTSAWDQWWYIVGPSESRDYWERLSEERAAFDAYRNDYHNDLGAELTGEKLPDWAYDPSQMRPFFYQGSRAATAEEWQATLDLIEAVTLGLPIVLHGARPIVSILARKLGRSAVFRARMPRFPHRTNRPQFVTRPNRLGDEIAGSETAEAAEAAFRRICQPPAPRSEAQRLLAAARRAEPRVTGHLQGINQSVGGELVGLDNRLKTLASLEEKLVQRGVPASNINDVLRYTMTFSEDTFSASAKRAMAQLESLGYEKVVVRNSFRNNARYKGINTTFKTPDGQLFELQFHTPQSFYIKQNVNHALYEELRLLSRDSPRWDELEAQIKANSALIPNPPGVRHVR